MPKLETLLDAIHESAELSSAEELKRACALIIEVQNMPSRERDTLNAAFERGPLFDGDVPSKSGRDELVARGYMARIVMSGNDGFNACTYKGAMAVRLLRARDPV